MNPRTPCILLLILTAALAAAQAQPPAADRVGQIAAMLPPQPRGVGRPISDRKAWDQLGQIEAFQKKIAQAETLLNAPIPDQPDELYLDYSKTGNRTRWQDVAGKRRGQIATLVLAECIENKGRFIQPLENVIAAICKERTWVMPAHDGALSNFKAEKITIDLGSSMLAYNLATADHMLADKLSPPIRQMIRERAAHFIFQPYRDMIEGKRGGDWWIRTTNNWNAVCLAGVTGAALTLLESPHDRALFVAAAELYSQNFLKGFTPDGYCTEGLGYWNYGFGYYILLAETIWHATDGKLDFLARPEVQAPARFGANIEIINGIYPAFADCGVGTRPDGQLMSFLSRRFQLGLTEWEKIPLKSPSGALYEVGLYAFTTSADTVPPGKPSLGAGPRSWFGDMGILICRPIATDAYPFAVALKGGHNNEHHNHNDVGSFVAVNDRIPLILDPGGETYTARTFSAQRYVSGVLNSFGHAVPLVAGKLQRTGQQAAAKIIDTDFTDNADKLVLDIKAAYDVPELQSLQREFIYSRAAQGSLQITDRFAFASPEAFGNALITFNQFAQPDPATLLIYNSEKCFEVKIETEGGEVEIKTDIIPDGKKPTRIGINLKQPVSQGFIRATIRPLLELPKGLPGIYSEPSGPSFQPDIAKAIPIEAENFSAQQGGEVNVCEKIGASGKALKLWDPIGHALEWKFQVSAPADYTIQIRQCQDANAAALRDVFIDGKPIGANAEKGRFMIPPTGGWSSKTDDWKDTWLAQNGEAPRIRLEPGEHTLRMVSADGKGVNLDLIRIVPMK